MTYILSLITDPAQPIAEHSMLSVLQEHIDISNRVVLAEGVAIDIPLANDIDIFMLRALLADLPVDVNKVSGNNRTKKLLIADMDSTIIQQECIDELAAHIGKYNEIADITERAMRGEMDFDAALLERVSMLAGLSEKVISETWEHRISFTAGAKTLIETMKKRGVVTALVSGGFMQFTGKVKETLGFDTHSANQLVCRDGVLTGEVEKPILGRAAKAEALNRLCQVHDLLPEDCIAVGDGANDLDMINLAGMGVAFHAKPATAAAADHIINYGDLTALLYLQGIPKDQHC